MAAPSATEKGPPSAGIVPRRATQPCLAAATSALRLTQALKLGCRHAFGVAADAANGLHWLNENTLLYPVGHSVALCNTESKAQRFIQASPESSGISALALTPNRKYLALGEQAEKGTVTIFDLASLKRRKVLISSVASGKARVCWGLSACADCRCKLMPDFALQDIVSMAFSADGHLLAVQGGAPDWLLVVWVWEKAKTVDTLRITATAAFAPVCQVQAASVAMHSVPALPGTGE